MTARIRRNDNVRVINTNSLYVGRVGVVTSISRVRQTFDVRLCMLSNAPEVTMTFDLDDLKLDRDVSMDELDALVARREVLIAEQATKQAEYEARLKQRELDEYLAARNEPAQPLVREQRDDRVIFGVTRPCSNGVDTYVSDRITIYNHASYGRSVPNVSVNWSALGSVSPEEALAFAQALASAAVEAMAIRDAKERELGITR